MTKRITYKVLLASLMLGLGMLCAPATYATTLDYTFKKLESGDVVVSGSFKDVDNSFYDAIESLLKTGELVDVVTQVTVRPAGVWTGLKSKLYRPKEVAHKRLSLDLFTDEVSLHRTKNYTTILPLKDLKDSILSFSNIKLIHGAEAKPGQTYIIDIALSYHRGVIDEDNAWQKVSRVPGRMIRFLPDALLMPTLNGSLSYKYK